MTVTIITPSDTFDLTTLARVKRELQITGTTSDEWLADIIHEESETFAGLTKRVLAEETVSETFDLKQTGLGLEFLRLSRYPTTSITTVDVDDTEVDAADYRLDGIKGMLFRISGTAKVRWTGSVATITYRGGYELLGTLPRRIESAVLTMVRARWFGGRRDPAIRSEEAYGVQRLIYSAGTTGSGQGLPPDVQSAVDYYMDYRSVA